MTPETFAEELDRARPDLRDYLRRLLLNADAVEDVLQTTALRGLAGLDKAPVEAGQLRPWLFRVATNLAVDEIRRRKRWRPGLLMEARPRAEDDAAFVEMSAGLRGSPQMSLVAREHLAACFACTLRALTAERAAALLLREVYGFTLDETAAILESRPAQVKNWLQEARRIMTAYYEDRCALIRKGGVCYQCAELAGFFNGREENPLERGGSLRARLRIVREMRRRHDNPWHQRLFAIFDDLES